MGELEKYLLSHTYYSPTDIVHCVHDDVCNQLKHHHELSGLLVLVVRTQRK